MLIDIHLLHITPKNYFPKLLSEEKKSEKLKQSYGKFHIDIQTYILLLDEEAMNILKLKGEVRKGSKRHKLRKQYKGHFNLIISIKSYTIHKQTDGQKIK